MNWHMNTAIKPAVAIYTLKTTKNAVVHIDCTTIKQVILKNATFKTSHTINNIVDLNAGKVPNKDLVKKFTHKFTLAP